MTAVKFYKQLDFKIGFQTIWGLLEIIRSTTAYYLWKYLFFKKNGLMQLKYIGFFHFCDCAPLFRSKIKTTPKITSNFFLSLETSFVPFLEKKQPLHKVIKEPDAFKQPWICPFINFEFTFLGLKCLKIKMLMVQILVVCPWQPLLKWLLSKRVPGSW